jgi:hypothetical protein
MNENEEIKANLQRAETNLQAARDLVDKEYFDIAAARAYYSAFYAASALLLSQGIDTNKQAQRRHCPDSPTLCEDRKTGQGTREELELAF